MNLQGQVVPQRTISPGRRDEMYRLMDSYYTGMCRNVFENDLNRKDWIIQIVQSDSGILCGFSTQVLWESWSAGHAAGVLFSGDTIIDHRYRSNNPLARTWGRFVLGLIDEHEGLGKPLYWFLIVKGYKTYRFLPLFFHQFYPRYDAVTPSWARRLINRLGRTRFPSQYEAETGRVRALPNGYRLRGGVADVTAARLRDPHVRFFAENNPGHTAGDELCCIAPLTRANFTPAAQRVIGDQTVSAARA